MKNQITLGPDHYGPLVYFVQGGAKGPIKIGFTDNIDMRLRHMQATSPIKLFLRGIIIDPLKKEREAALHERFAAARLHGEWFKPTAELLAFIAEHTERYDIPDRAPNAPRGREPDPNSPTAIKRREAAERAQEAIRTRSPGWTRHLPRKGRWDAMRAAFAENPVDHMVRLPKRRRKTVEQ